MDSSSPSFTTCRKIEAPKGDVFAHSQVCLVTPNPASGRERYSGGHCYSNRGSATRGKRQMEEKRQSAIKMSHPGRRRGSQYTSEWWENAGREYRNKIRLFSGFISSGETMHPLFIYACKRYLCSHRHTVTDCSATAGETQSARAHFPFKVLKNCRLCVKWF